MKPRPRIRNTAKWTSAAATLLLLGAWVASMFSITTLASGKGHFLRLRDGCVTIGDVYLWAIPEYFGVGWEWDGDSQLFWWFRRGEMTMGQWWFCCPLWLPLVLSLSTTTLLFHLDHRARRRANLNLCPHCNYNLTGLPPTTPCPECGKLRP